VSISDYIQWLSLYSVFQAVPAKLSLDALLQMSSAQVEDTMKRLGSSSEECSRITTALSCLKSATNTGHRSPLSNLHVAPALGFLPAFNSSYIKGLVHPKMKILSVFTHPHVVWIKQISIPIDYHRKKCILW